MFCKMQSWRGEVFLGLPDLSRSSGDMVSLNLASILTMVDWLRLSLSAPSFEIDNFGNYAISRWHSTVAAMFGDE